MAANVAQSANCIHVQLRMRKQKLH